MTYNSKTLTDQKIILDGIPGAPNHNGGRIKFGPDKFLYIGTGDAQNPSQAQNTNSLGGKILRIKDDGEIPADNPFHNPVYSYGHRNVQGLAWDNQGRLWATEHGRSGIQSGLDEINLIEKGKNYGWPIIQGNEKRGGMETPRLNSGPTTTWAPSGLAFLDGVLYFGGLRGRTLYEALTDNLALKEHFKDKFGRIRDVIVGPEGLLYITTSNQDGRGNPKKGDDKIIRVNPKKLQ
jgi:glucose/arabinose dehydrogenase